MHLSEYARATGVFVIFVFATVLILPVLSPYLKSFGFSYIQLSLIFSGMALAKIIFSPISGKISDDIGRVRVVKAGIALEIAAIFIYILSSSWQLFVTAKILEGVAITAAALVALAKIEDSAEKNKRGEDTGRSLSIEHVSRLFAPILGGFLADYFFVEAPFFLSIGILITLFFLLPKPKTKNTKIHNQDFNWFAEIKNFLSYRELKGISILGMAMHFSMAAGYVFLPLMVVENFGLSYSYAGIAYFALGFGYLFQFIFGKWADKKGKTVLLLGTSIMGTFSLAVYFASSYYLLLLFLFINGFGGGMFNVSVWTLLSRIGEREKKEGEILGCYFSIAKVGGLVSYIVSGFIVQYYGIPFLFLVVGIVQLAGTALTYLFLRK